ncbi:MAG TPA: YihY/virulence factor BrkB family protein [Gaiellaceae bacterium]
MGSSETAAAGAGTSGLRRFAAATVRGIENYFADYGTQLAAAISYKAIFSVIPIVTFAVTVIGVVLRDPGRRDAVIDGLIDRLPLEAADGGADLERILTSIPSPWSVIGLVSLLAVVWAASGVMGSVRIGLTVAAGGERGRSYGARKLLDLLLVLLVAVLVLAAAVLNVVTRAVTAWSDGVAEALGKGALGALFNDLVSGFAAPAVLLFGASVFLYRYVPPRRARWRYVLIGAAFAGVVLQAIQLVMAWYLAGPADYDAVYGSLGTALAFLLAVYVAATAFLIGGELVFAWDGRQLENDADEDEGGVLGWLRRRLEGTAA